MSDAPDRDIDVRDQPVRECIDRYWAANVRIMVVLLSIWAFFGLGCGVLFADWLNRFRRETRVVPPTFSGGGLAAGDVNGDGRADLLFVGGLGNTLYLDVTGSR